jgi:hypothetical protein
MQISHKKIKFILQTSDNYVNVTYNLLFLKGRYVPRVPATARHSRH